MKKNLILFGLSLLICFNGHNLIANAEQTKNEPAIKEVYVNLDMVWRSSNQGKKDIEELNKIVDKAKVEIESIKTDLKTIKDQSEAITDKKIKEEKAIAFENKKRELIELTNKNNKLIEDFRAKSQQTFVSEILPVINTYRKDKGIIIVHRYNLNEIISIDPKIDATEDILKLYSK